MKNKILLISIIIITIVALGIGGYFLFNGNKEKQDIKDNKIVSTVILDINPSVEIGLNKDEEVVEVKPLNKDGANVVSDNLVGKKLDEAINTITEKVVENGYTLNDKVTVLVTTTGDISTTQVEKLVTDAFTSKEVTTDVITQSVSESAKSIASEYNISEGKASYIEKIIKEKSNLTIGELKDKSIEELEVIKNREEEKVEDPPKVVDEPTTKPTETTTKPTDTTTTTKSNTTSSKAPSDPKDPAWCSFNKTRAAVNYKYPTPNSNSTKVFLDSQNLKTKIDGGTIISVSSIGGTDSRSSYCMCSKVLAVSNTTRYSAIVDPYDGTIIDVKTESAPSFLDESKIIEIGLEANGLTKDDERINYYWSSFIIHGYSNETWDYAYQVNVQMKDGSDIPSVDVRATDGKVLSIFPNDLVRSGTYKY